eukprot:4855490-Amphidinium_carterae.1
MYSRASAPSASRGSGCTASCGQGTPAKECTWVKVFLRKELGVPSLGAEKDFARFLLVMANDSSRDLANVLKYFSSLGNMRNTAKNKSRGITLQSQ